MKPIVRDEAIMKEEVSQSSAYPDPAMSVRSAIPFGRHLLGTIFAGPAGMSLKKIRRTKSCKRGLSFAMKRLAAEAQPEPKSAHAARSAKGWTPERRARQAERNRLSRPWRFSTGPKTEAGKARVAMNTFRHGCRGRVWLEKARRIRRAIRICAETVLLARALTLLERSGSEAQAETSSIPAWTQSAKPATASPQGDTHAVHVHSHSDHRDLRLSPQRPLPFRYSDDLNPARESSL
jgi:hypothetical protein